MLKNISEKIGFTQTEIKVIIFLAVIFITGFGVKSLVKDDEIIPSVFNYSEQDSLFASTNLNDAVNYEEIADKKIDYKQEVLDFKEIDFKNSKEKELPPENSININSAGLEELEKLPGIGKKTAGNIISFREKISKFQKLQDLLEVKGIGNSKFNKIKKYLYIE